MKKLIIVIMLLLCIGCQHGDFKFSIVHQGDIAPHDGYFVVQSWYLYTGDIVPDDGFLIWIKGADPNDL